MQGRKEKWQEERQNTTKHVIILVKLGHFAREYTEPKKTQE